MDGTPRRWIDRLPSTPLEPLHDTSGTAGVLRTVAVVDWGSMGRHSCIGIYGSPMECLGYSCPNYELAHVSAHCLIHPDPLICNIPPYPPPLLHSCSTSNCTSLCRHRSCHASGRSPLEAPFGGPRGERTRCSAVMHGRACRTGQGERSEDAGSLGGKRCIGVNP